jgi:hypothetical protein
MIRFNPQSRSSCSHIHAATPSSCMTTTNSQSRLGGVALRAQSSSRWTWTLLTSPLILPSRWPWRSGEATPRHNSGAVVLLAGPRLYVMHVLADRGGVRDVISSDGSPDRFPDLRRALIGGACRFVAVGPPRAASYKREASRGTGTNVHRALSAATNPNLRPINRGAEARGLAPPRLCDRRPMTYDTDRPPTPRLQPATFTMSSSSSPQGISS